MEPVEYYRALRTWWWVVAAAFVLGLVAAWVTAPASTTEYEGSRTLTVEISDEASGEFALDRLAFAVTNGAVPERVAERIGFDDHPTVLAEQISASVDPTVQTIAIAAVDTNADRADELAAVFAEELQLSIVEEEQAEDQALAERVRAIEADIGELETQADGLPVDSLQRASLERDIASLSGERDEVNQDLQEPAPYEFETIPPTEAAVASSGPNRLQRMSIAGLVGGLLGIGLALLCARFDPRIRTKEQAQRGFGLPVLAEVPVVSRSRRKLAEIVTVSDPESLAGQAYRSLRTSLLLKPAPRHLSGVPGAKSMRMTFEATPARDEQKRGTKVVVVASPGMAEGKTTTTANLAAAFAETGRRVLVLECDLRRPTIGRYLGVEDGPGLGEALMQSDEELHLEDFIRTTSVPRVRVITAGQPAASPDELLSRIARVIEASRQFADVVVVDTAPLLATDDASVLVPMADDVVIVCRAGRTPIDAAERATELLTRLGAPLNGVVIVGATVLPTTRGYYRADHRFWQPQRLPARTGGDKPTRNGSKTWTKRLLGDRSGHRRASGGDEPRDIPNEG